MPVSIHCRASIVINRSRQLCEDTQRLIDQSDELIRQTQIKIEFMRLRRSIDPGGDVVRLEPWQEETNHWLD
jgi:hypothetical protein